MRLAMVASVVLAADLKASGGLTETVFPGAEVLLQQLEYQRACDYLDDEVGMGGFESLMDWLYVSVYREHEEACQAFYEGHGEQLREILSPPELRFRDRVLVGALEKAKTALDLDREVTWEEMRP